MATQPPAAPRYDWEPPLTSERPDDLQSSDLPDITAPATDALPTEDEHVPAPDPVPPPRRRFPPLAIVAIVLVVVAGMVAGLGIVAANFVSTSAGMTFSFLVNGRFTFRAERPTLRSAMLFVATTGVTMWVLQPIVIHLVQQVVEPMAVVKLLAIGASFVVNFLAYRHIVWPAGHRHG